MRQRAPQSASERARVGVAALVGVIVALVSLQTSHKGMALLWGWDAGALVYVLWIGLTLFRMDSGKTAALASSEDPDRVTTDMIILMASVASLGAIVIGLTQAGQAHGAEKTLYVGTCLLSIVLSWALVHTTFALRYARLYYNDDDGGIDFPGEGDPCYLDFAYVAFTVGMTFQVSDTDVGSSQIRRAVLRQALISYLFGTVFVATMINLIAGFMKQ
jgi:uncharacterized membrane protein